MSPTWMMIAWAMIAGTRSIFNHQGFVGIGGSSYPGVMPKKQQGRPEAALKF